MKLRCGTQLQEHGPNLGSRIQLATQGLQHGNIWMDYWLLLIVLIVVYGVWNGHQKLRMMHGFDYTTSLLRLGHHHLPLSNSYIKIYLIDMKEDGHELM
jgi:hypothetical protein